MLDIKRSLIKAQSRGTCAESSLIKGGTIGSSLQNEPCFSKANEKKLQRGWFLEVISRRLQEIFYREGEIL